MAKLETYSFVVANQCLFLVEYVMVPGKAGPEQINSAGKQVGSIAIDIKTRVTRLSLLADYFKGKS